MGDPDDRWYFTKERLNETPSRKHGFDSDKELSCRQQAANFIQDMGQKLCVSQLCINTAIVYMHRFYVFHSLVQFHRTAIATAALFLAAKVEEQPRKVEHVLKVAHLCLHREAPTLDTKSESYLEQSNDLVLNESILLQTLGFDVAIDHPHTHVVRCCQLVKASKDLAQTSYFMASNSLHLTTMCLQYRPTVVACFCIHLACKWSNWEIPRSSEGKDWFWYVNQSVTLDLLEQLTSEFLLIFDKCPTKLKRKMMSLNQNNPPVNFGHLGGSQENCHFDEPRKLMGAEANRPPEGFLQMQKNAEKTVPSSSNNGASSSQAQAQAQPQSLNHPPRHIDYKEYKEKKEREKQDRDRVDRAPRDISSSNSGAPVAQAHGAPKPQEKVKSHSSQRPSSTAQPHKGYPQQRSHSSTQPVVPTKEGYQRPPVKEAVKRKFEEVDNGQPIDPNFQDSSHAKSYPRNPEEFRHKILSHGHSSTSNLPGHTSDAHGQTKDYTPTGIREIIVQPFPQREKSHRPTEGERHNYPYQRTDKYGSSSRSGQPSVITKTHREDMPKKQEEAPRSIEESPGNPDWHNKPSSVITGHTSNHGVDRHSSISQQQMKQRDPKFKSHHQTPQKDTTQKHPLNLAQGGTHSSIPSHKKSAEKSTEKNRKYQEQLPSQQQPSVAERGLPSSMDSLLLFDEVHPKQMEQKRHHSEMHKKDKLSSSSKFPSKHKHLIAPVKPQEQTQVSLFDIPMNNDMELPSLIDQQEMIERPAKIPRLDDRKKIFEHDKHKPYGGVISEPIKTSSIFSPDNNSSPSNNISSYEKDNRKADLHYSNHSKKQISSLFSPPSLSGMPSHRSGSSSGSSSERELIIPLTSVPTPVIKQDKEYIIENDNMLPSLDEILPKKKYYKEKIFKDKIINNSSVISSNHLPVPSSSMTQVTRSHHSNRHSSTNEVGAIIFPPSDKGKSNNNNPSNSTNNQVPTETKLVSPVSTVNLLGMEKMVDTSISPTLSAVIKPATAVRPDQPLKVPPITIPLSQIQPTQTTPPASIIIPPLTPTIALIPHTEEDDTQVEDETAEPPTEPNPEEVHKHRKHEKKKKDKDRDGHRHKEKKKSDGKKEKKKHKDKDKKKDRDRDKHRDKTHDYQNASISGESSLKITIPKDKLPEGSLKIKIAKERLIPEDISAPEGSLKIKIKKDVIANYKEDKKRKDSHHKSSKASKSSEGSSKHSK